MPLVEHSEEDLQQPDLLAAYWDREVTLFGMTGTLGDLAAMCKRDLSDPSITLAMKNEFVVKAANEAGIAIEPEHEAIFTKITEQHGLERKFTTATLVETPAVERKEPTTPSLAQIRTKSVETNVSNLHAELEAARLETAILETPINAEQLVKQHGHISLEADVSTPEQPYEVYKTAAVQLAESASQHSIDPEPSTKVGYGIRRRHARSPLDEATHETQTSQLASSKMLSKIEKSPVHMIKPDFKPGLELSAPIRKSELAFDKFTQPANFVDQVRETIGLTEPASVPELAPKFELSPVFEITPTLELVSDPTPAETTVQIMSETMELTEQQTEETATLIVALPETVQVRLAEFMQSDNVEAVTAVQELVLQIAAVLERLHVLFAEDKLQGEEAIEIEKILAVWYEELMTQLDMPYDETECKHFIALVCSENYKSILEAAPNKPAQDFTHEILRFPRRLSNWGHHFSQQLIGRCAVTLASS